LRLRCTSSAVFYNKAKGKTKTIAAGIQEWITVIRCFNTTREVKRLSDRPMKVKVLCEIGCVVTYSAFRLSVDSPLCRSVFIWLHLASQFLGALFNPLDRILSGFV
jgi:hypothetical protein